MDKPNQLFKAFADETRLRILNLLAQRECCVCELQQVIRAPQPTISRHLAYLRRTGMVTERKQGKWVLYSLAPASNSVHEILLRCVKCCFSEIDFLSRDLERARKMKPIRCD